LVGWVPAPFQSGETAHDQGITRAGNKHVRRLMVQLAWSWRRFQPASALTRWYEQRCGHGSRRLPCNSGGPPAREWSPMRNASTHTKPRLCFGPAHGSSTRRGSVPSVPPCRRPFPSPRMSLPRCRSGSQASAA
jgi:hypothetical protein